MKRREFIGTTAAGASLTAQPGPHAGAPDDEAPAGVVVERALAGRPHAGKVLLAIQPHADDIPLFAAGTVAKLLDEGYTGHLVRVTNDDMAGPGTVGVDIGATIDRKVEANLANLAQGPAGRAGERLRASLAERRLKLPALGDDDATANRQYVKEFVLRANRELGRKHGFPQSAPRKIRVGIVGGNFGRSFYFHEHPDCVVEAVSDLRPERRQALMEAYRCPKSYESLEKLILDPNVDAVAVFTPAPDHVRVRQLPEHEKYEQPAWWATDMLPAPLRHDSGHEGSHTFLTNEFVDALVKGRRPAVDVHEALAYTAPGIVAHQSALKGGVQMKIPSFDPAS